LKKLHLEIALVVVFVLGSTTLFYWWLAQHAVFWTAQNFWSIALLVCWGIVAFSYYRQGVMVRNAKSSSHVSLLLPIVVFVVQCILFVKGVYYKDYALVVGAVLVNSGVVFEIYQILSLKK
jgi:hypothetical protein